MPGCNGDTSCNAGYQAAQAAYTFAAGKGAGATATPWWLDVENFDQNWSTNLAENAQYVQGAILALHESEGIADVGIYASPAVWNTIVGNYQPSVPYWMADYLASPERTWLVQRLLQLGEQPWRALAGATGDRPIQQHTIRRRLRLLIRPSDSGRLESAHVSIPTLPQARTMLNSMSMNSRGGAPARRTHSRCSEGACCR